MTKNERLEALKNLLENTKEPMSGSALAKELHVSRQVIVQDIALLKASDVPVLSTNRGYILPDQGVKEIIKVHLLLCLLKKLVLILRKINHTCIVGFLQTVLQIVFQLSSIYLTLW